MEDVILHYKPGTGDLKSLVEKTERVLEPFPCRVLPAFTPWFPSNTDRWLPIRPLRPPPVITQASTQENIKKVPVHQDSSSSSRNTDVACCSRTERPPYLASGFLQCLPEPNTEAELSRQSTDNKQKNLNDVLASTDIRPDRRTRENTNSPETKKQKHDNVLLNTDSKPNSKTKDYSGDEAQTHKDGLLAAGRELQRSWSVYTQRGLIVQNHQSLSKQFHKTVWSHRLHLRQRARLVVSEQNCTDMEQVWRDLNRAIRSSKLPTCNANIQRDQAQIWVFCDVLYCESVGKYLKEELGLTGRIALSVNKLGEIFSF